MGDDLAEGTAIARDGMFIPEWLPPATEVNVGREGWIWLKREEVPDARHATWELLNPAGDRLGRIRIPANWRIQSVKGAEAWTDEPAGRGAAPVARESA